VHYRVDTDQTGSRARMKRIKWYIVNYDDGDKIREVLAMVNRLAVASRTLPKRKENA